MLEFSKENHDSILFNFYIWNVKLQFLHFQSGNRKAKRVGSNHKNIVIMEKLNLSKFSDKKLENLEEIKGGQGRNLVGTHWENSANGHHGVDWQDTDTGEVGGYLRTL